MKDNQTKQRLINHRSKQTVNGHTNRSHRKKGETSFNETKKTKNNESPEEFPHLNKQHNKSIQKEPFRLK
jgi:hypothetical protein